MGNLRIDLLGGFAATYNNEAIKALEKARLQELLAYLTLHRHAPISRQQLAYAFWPEASDKQARKNLRTLLSRLRQALPDAGHLLVVDAQSVRWRADASCALDVAEFEQALAEGERAQQVEKQASALEPAIECYRGALLPDCYDDWVAPERERLRNAYLQALEQLLLLLEEQRRYDAAIRYGQRLLREDPLHEAAYRRLMRLHALNGNRAGALRIYHTCTNVLQRELGVEPGLKTREAYQRLLNPTATASPVPEPLVGTTPLVGRQREWSSLVSAWKGAASGKSGIVALTGEAGIGKTRLAEELTAWAERQGIAVGVARCYAMEGDLAYGPVIEWLRSEIIRQRWAALDDVWLSEIARLLPELLSEHPDLAAPGPLNERWQRQRLFEALARAMLAGGRPLLLFIDDLQWSDRETLDWLHYLLQYAPQAPLLILGAVRLEEVEDEHRYAPFRLVLQRSGHLSEIPLKALTESETATLAIEMTGHSLALDEAETLYRDTEGNPLFVVEMMRAGTEVGDRRSEVRNQRSEVGGQEAVTQNRSLPPKVASVLQHRLFQLSPPTLALIQLAAVIGREFTFDLLAQACDQTEDTVVEALDEAWQRRIVREQGVNAYDFSHDKLRAVAYAQVSSARRRLLHRRVAETLARRHAGDLYVISGQIAGHYEQAGLAEQAISCYRRAAEAARHVYANEDAITYYQRGIALLGAVSPDVEKQEMAARLYEGMGDVYMLIGKHDEARAAYQEALARTPVHERLRQATQHRKIGNTQTTQHRYDEAQSSYRQAEKLLGAESESPDLDWRQAWIQLQLSLVALHYGRGENEELAALLQAIRPVVEAHGTAVQRAEFLESAAMLGMRRGRYAMSGNVLEDQRAALLAWREAGGQGGIANNQFNLGFCHLWRRELDAAERSFQAALKLALEIGHARTQTMCVTYQAMLQRFRGDVEGAQQLAEQGLAMSEQGGIRFYIGMAQANLAWAAVRRGRMEQGEVLGREALENMSLVYPFRWAALWPLVGVALERQELATAMDCARQLLDPTQQRLPDEMTRALEAALAAWDGGEASEATLHLRRAAEMAVGLGYL